MPACYVTSCPILCDPMGYNQAPLSMGFSRKEYWSGLTFPSPGGLPDAEIEPKPPAWQADSLPPNCQGIPSQGISTEIISFPTK